MTLPVGISTCIVTIGPAYSFAGEEGVVSGTLVADRNIVWTATGSPIFRTAQEITSSERGGQAAFVVPHVDQPGFIDPAGNSITGWYYMFEGRATFPDGRFERIYKRFQVLTGQTEVELDLVPDGPVIPGVQTPSAAVLSIAGLTGTVTVDDLVEALDGHLGGTGGSLTPDPDNPGFYTAAGSSLTPDPEHPGFYLIGA